ncbi:MAG: hypothetical protein PHP32_00780 [Candidatus Izemoplasmatales bacterium]|nr:hypothetical protein [Candidatus Izemoplasmatales bacterium]
MKKRSSIVLTALCLSFSLSACGGSETPKESETQKETVVESEVETAPEVSETEEETETEPEVPHRTGEDIVGISEGSIEDIKPTFYDSVINDKTGNWRCAVMAENIDILDYVLSYYKNYFKNDSEIHAIVNLTLKTTTKITCSGGTLYVSQYDYVDGEEHDANIMFSGTYLSQDWVYTDNGDIEKVE